MTPISGLRDIAERFDLFLLDQFGVLHDGVSPYPESNAALELLSALAKPSVIISNSGKRADLNIRRMQEMGVPRHLYTHLVTSGEVAWSVLRSEVPGAAPKPGRRCFLISSGGSRSPVDGLDVTLVEAPDKADFILLAGSEGHVYGADHYRALLEPGARAEVPCFCTNPDRIALAGSVRSFGPGRIAEIYQELGGSVRWIGKPYREIYDHAIGLFPAIERTRILCVGDSIEHDIVGARNAGLRSVLVRGGILENCEDREIEALTLTHGARPDYVMMRFAP